MMLGGVEIVLLRPIFNGGAMLSWIPGQSWPYGLPEESVWMDMLDFLGMP